MKEPEIIDKKELIFRKELSSLNKDQLIEMLVNAKGVNHAQLVRLSESRKEVDVLDTENYNLKRKIEKMKIEHHDNIYSLRRYQRLFENLVDEKMHFSCFEVVNYSRNEKGLLELNNDDRKIANEYRKEMYSRDIQLREKGREIGILKRQLTMSKKKVEQLKEIISENEKATS